MFIVCWSPKGGSGTSVVAAALGLTIASSGRETLLVDTVGDLPMVLGLPPGNGDGLSDWLLAPSDVSADALSLLEMPAGERLQLLGAGNATEKAIDPERTVLAAELLSRSARWVVVDAGSTGPPDPWLVQGASAVMVIRACYLGIQAALARPLALGNLRRCGGRTRQSIAIVRCDSSLQRTQSRFRALGSGGLASSRLGPSRAPDATFVEPPERGAGWLKHC